MPRPGTIALVLLALAQMASVLGFALRGHVTASDRFAMPQQVDLLATLLKPQIWLAWGLLGAAMAALGAYAARRLQDGLRARRARRADTGPADPPDLPPAAIGPLTAGSMARLYDDDQTLAEHAPLLIGLSASALWPWLIAPLPLAAQLLALIAVAGVLSALLRGRRRAGRITQSWPLGFFAGWIWLLGSAALARALQDRTGTSGTDSAILAMLTCAGGAFALQLHLGRRIGFSVAVIWGLIAMAAATVFVNAAVALVAMLCIACIALGLVRATT